MKHVFLLVLTSCLVAACSPSRTPEAAGEYNLSEGKCINIPDCKGDKCKTVKDESVLLTCDMIKGNFVPRNHKKYYWF